MAEKRHLNFAKLIDKWLYAYLENPPLPISCWAKQRYFLDEIANYNRAQGKIPDCCEFYKTDIKEPMLIGKFGAHQSYHIRMIFTNDSPRTGKRRPNFATIER